jgi:phosphohistidine phosphatase SixA
MQSLPPLLTALALFGSTPPLAAQEGVVVYLVRHAERAEDGSNDPPISEEGWNRAQLLSDMVRDAGITHVHVTSFKRTRETAVPLVARTGARLSTYDPVELKAFAAELRRTPGRHLVVGHSDTTFDLVWALGGDPGSAIPESEYDRLYVVVLVGNEPFSVLLRFGAPPRG